ncbi:LytR/AlgR family response regulator transcription factor [Niallia sp. JL1B1071]|uniref:LytR/AlgR family response regulator transcription factor n=1 Tax=Niallia tiangongensis TaxID=3237105 RepID=UPI0037DD22A3
MLHQMKGVIMSIRTIIADGDNQMKACIRYYLKAYKQIEIIDECGNGMELVDKLLQWQPDLVITEINLPLLNGLEVMKQCSVQNLDVHFIFLAESEEFAFPAFELEATDYLVKPIEKFRLYKAIEKAKRMIAWKIENKELVSFNNLPVKYSKGIHYIKKEDILFIEKIEKKCYIYTTDKVFETQENIGDLLNQLNDTFLLSHRSYIINLEKVVEVRSCKETFIAFFNGVERGAKISKLKINEVKKRMSDLLKI